MAAQGIPNSWERPFDASSSPYHGADQWQLQNRAEGRLDAGRKIPPPVARKPVVPNPRDRRRTHPGSAMAPGTDRSITQSREGAMDYHADRTNVPFGPARAPPPPQASPGTIASLDQEDLANLDFLDNNILLEQLQKRFTEGQPYTYIGDSLVAVNPCTDLGIYTQEHHKKYKDLRVRSSERAHIYWVAAQMYRNLITTGSSQCVVVGGDSGAGKTESTKFILHHLVHIGTASKATHTGDREPLVSDVVGKLEKVSPILEIFGNASTVLNNNSSRFAKLVELGYDRDGILTTAHLECFILEKFRVTSRNPLEKNFHVFYALFEDNDLAAKLGLDMAPESYRILKPDDQTEGVFRSVKEKDANRARYDEMKSMLSHVGFTPEEELALFKALAAVLLITNVEFEDLANGDAIIQIGMGEMSLDGAARVLGLENVEDLRNSLLVKSIEVKATDEKLTRGKTERQATADRDALARELYSVLFYGVVDRLNHILHEGSNTASLARNACIRLLDISGFENVADHNGFEQFIINATNERLHQYFLQHTFHHELQDYADEGLGSLAVTFTDNVEIVDLIFKKPEGLIPLLEDEVATNGKDERWLNKCRHRSKPSSRFQAKAHTAFSLQHYAGKVLYTARGFVAKNSDTLPKNLREVVQRSDNIFIRDYFLMGSAGAAAFHKSGRASLRKRSKLRRDGMPTTFVQNEGGMSQQTGKLSVRFTEQYMTSLSGMMGKLQTATPIFVRCIKPNIELQRGQFDSEVVRMQLQSSGMLEVTRIRKEGYPIRVPFKEFVTRHSKLLDSVDVTTATNQEQLSQYCDDILSIAQVTGHRMGHRKVFLKLQHQDQLELATQRKLQEERAREERARQERESAEKERAERRETERAERRETEGAERRETDINSTTTDRSSTLSDADSSDSGFAFGHSQAGEGQHDKQIDTQVNISETDTVHEETANDREEEKQKDKEASGTQPAYDVFRLTERDFEDSNLVEMKIRRCVRLVLYILIFCLILGDGVVARIALIWLNSKELKGTKAASELAFLLEDKSSQRISDFRFGLTPFRLLMCQLLPLLLTWLSCLLKIFFSRKDWPSFKALILITLLDCAGVVGRSVFLFKVLPSTDILTAVVLGTGVCQVPAVLKMISLCLLDNTSLRGDVTPGRWSRIRHYLYFPLVALAMLVQLAVVPLLYFSNDIISAVSNSNITLRLPDLWALVVAVLCSSVGWWENFAYGKVHTQKDSSSDNENNLPSENSDAKGGSYPAEHETNSNSHPPEHEAHGSSHAAQHDVEGGSHPAEHDTKSESQLSLSALRVQMRNVRQASYVYTGPIQMIVAISLFFALNDANIDLSDQIYVLFNSFGAGFGDIQVLTNHLSVYGLMYMQITGTFISSFLAGMACYLHMQNMAFALPVQLVAPACMALAVGCTPSNLAHWYDLNCVTADLTEVHVLFVLVMGIAVWLSTVVINMHVWQPEIERKAKIEKLFVFPHRDSIFPDLSLQCCRRQDKLENAERKWYHKTLDGNSNEGVERPIVYICATMWHENRREMLQLLKSLFRVDLDVYIRKKAQKRYKIPEEHIDLYEPKIHVIFDDAFETDDKNGPHRLLLNTYVRQFMEVIPEAIRSVAKKNLDLKTPTKVSTPYGGRLLWELPGGTKMYVHLKDKGLIRQRKRWSQIMYLYYLLGHRLMRNYKTADEVCNVTGRNGERRHHHKSRNNTSLLNDLDLPIKEQADNIFILTLDGDVDFRPEAVRLLLDRMKKNKQVAAVCGRIHPIGDGPMVWYQKFEYAVGHWLQKAAEHVFGCVLCCPGCFSLFRGSALMDDNVMRMYTTEPTEAIHHIQCEQGEDRWLCTLLLQQGWRIEYCAGADALTFAPETFHEFYIQRRRWSPSTMVNIVDLISSWRITVKTNNSISKLFMFYQFLLMSASILAPGLVVYMIAGSYTAVLEIGQWEAYLLSVFPVFFFILLCLKAESATQINVAAIMSSVYAIVMLLVTIGTIINVVTADAFSPDVLFLITVAVIFIVAGLVHPNELLCLIHGILYYITVPSTFVFLTVFFLCNLNEVSWGTREGPKKVDPAAEQGAQQPVQEKGRLHKFFEKLGLAAIVQDMKSFVQQMMGVKQELQGNNLQGGGSQNPQNLTTMSIPQQQEPTRTPSPVSAEPKTEPEVEPDRSYWIQKLDNFEGETIKANEKEFWTYIIGKYLLPIKADKKKQKKIKKDLLSARNNVVFAYMLLNLMFTLVLLQLRLQMDKLKDTFFIAGKYEPVSTVSLGVFSLLLLTQFCGMLGHRWSTFLHLIASTRLSWFNQDKEKERALIEIQKTQSLTTGNIDKYKEIENNPDYETDHDDLATIPESDYPDSEEERISAPVVYEKTFNQTRHTLRQNWLQSRTKNRQDRRGAHLNTMFSRGTYNGQLNNYYRV